ncbi:MAG: hypothetical protein K8F91_24815, partial [Candidatus Obscuribacterales bacterium]|nr:hypothetical protein [Candidatus Obscuribacterales bacterium]
GEQRFVTMRPVKMDLYSAYVNAMKKSATIIVRDGRKLGYVHVWCGGAKSHDALVDILTDELDRTDGLIFDLRDGYGGNSLEDLDRFYRTEVAYPTFVTRGKNGKTNQSREFYDKPIVALINAGSRSGKELLAFSLKRTGRARLVGTTTAGAVVAGRLFPINEKCSLYLAVLDGTVGGVRLEGNGVKPDLEVPLIIQPIGKDRPFDNQTEKAIEVLLEEIKQFKK